MIRFSVVTISLLVLMEIYSANFRYETRNVDLAVYVTKADSGRDASVTLFQRGTQININLNGADTISNGYYLNDGKQIFVNKEEEGCQRFSISNGSSTYVFSVDRDGNIDISSEAQNVDTWNMSFAFWTGGTVRNCNPILFDSLFLYGNKIQNDSILKTQNYIFSYKTFDNYGIFDSRVEKISQKQFESSSAILSQQLKRFKDTPSANASSTPLKTSVFSSAKNSKNNYGIILSDYVGYTGRALKVSSYGLTECNNMHFDGTDSELSVEKGKFLVHGTISGAFYPKALNVGKEADIHVHKFNMRFVDVLQQVSQSQQSPEFIETLNRMRFDFQEHYNRTIEYSHLWQWKFEESLNIGINQDLLLGAGFSSSDIEQRKWCCMDEELIDRNDYNKIESDSPIQINIPGVSGAVTLYLVSTGAGGGNSCGFLSLTRDRQSVYLQNAVRNEDNCRKDIIRKLTEAIDSENSEKVLELIAPQLMKYISTKGNARYNAAKNKYEWDGLEEEIWKEIEKIFLSEISGVPVDQLESSEENKEKVKNSEKTRDSKETQLLTEQQMAWSQIREEILDNPNHIELINLSDEEMSNQFTKKTKEEIIRITNRLYGLEIIKKNEDEGAATLDDAVNQIRQHASNAGAKDTYSPQQIKQLLTIYTSDHEQLQNLVMHYPALKSKFLEKLKIIEKKKQEIMESYQLPKTMKAYLDKFLGRTGIQLEVTEAETTGVLHAIAYIQKASLVLVADQEYTIEKVQSETHKKGDILLFYDNPKAESVIYVFVHPGHYSKAVTEEQYYKAVSEYNK